MTVTTHFDDMRHNTTIEHCHITLSEALEQIYSWTGNRNCISMRKAIILLTKDGVFRFGWFVVNAD